MKDRPFVLLGVNSDENRSDAKAAVEREQLTWRSWWDRSTDGPIATRWNVNAWPTMYLIDHAGRLRGQISPGEADAAVEDLVREAEKDR